MMSSSHKIILSNVLEDRKLPRSTSSSSAEEDDSSIDLDMVGRFAQMVSDGMGKGAETIPEQINLQPNPDGESTTDPSKPRRKHWPMTTDTTPIRFLKQLRSSSLVSKASTNSYESLDSLKYGGSGHNEDEICCNTSNRPNKITGEMGLQITIDPDNTEKLVFKFHHDRHFQYIHPHVFAPACLSNVQRMGGGGSGVAVFCGEHPDLGEIVMKHGGASDMKELFALTKISSELNQRGLRANKNAAEAARAMTDCLPEFKMLYISPQHILLKQKAIWGKLRKLIRMGSVLSKFSDGMVKKKNKSNNRFADLVSQIQANVHENNNDSFRSVNSTISFDDGAFLGPGSSIRIFECDSGKAKVFLDQRSQSEKPSLAIILPKDHVEMIDETAMKVDFSDDFDSLQLIHDDLSPIMQKHFFKFTLAQKRIGGSRAKTGSQWLYEGKLDGLLLANLISKFVATVRNLQALTLPEEVDVIGEVREEVQRLKESHEKSDALSTLSDQFVGNAVKKNFHPTKGRIRYLRKTCRDFLDDKLHLEPEEELPAKFLGIMIEPDAVMSDVFIGASTDPPMLHPDKDFWINLMSQAVSERECMSPNATKRVWTSGLCDAGIHNVFVSKDHLYFFDLGVPQLQSLPGFMTKFLFSFFHVLGMEEDESNNNEWVRRFVPEGDRLALTQETKDLLPMAYDAFEVSLNRIIEEIFDGDQSLRWLLLQYVTLQLLSDASFCLQRWNVKGGGRPRDDNHNQGLERWLWRALWDTYVAFDINTKESWERLQVDHPNCETSNTSIQNGIRASIAAFHLCPDELRMLIDSMIEEEGEDEDDYKTEDNTKRISFDRLPTKTKLSGLSGSGNKRRSIRWSSERLRESSLRALTTAVFEYNEPDDISTESSYDSDDSGSDSAILPTAFHHSDPRELSLSSVAEWEEN